MSLQPEERLAMTRRQLFGRAATGIGTAALASLLQQDLVAAPRKDPLGRAVNPETGGLAELPHFAPTAKRVIFLHQSGAPSQIELFDYKPKLRELIGTELPDSIRKGQRITGMTSHQDSFPVAPSKFDFKQRGGSGTWVSDLLPHTGKVIDDIALVRTMHTDAINHDPAITFIQTGSQQPGRPSLGAWLSYGLGSENQNLPAYVVLISQSTRAGNGQPLFSRLWDLGSCPPSIRASSSVRSATRCSTSPILRGLAGIPVAACSTDCRSSTECGRRRSATRKSRPAFRNMRWPTVCRRPCLT